jgi:threonine/homoserine efflux transporter RhtA
MGWLQSLLPGGREYARLADGKKEEKEAEAELMQVPGTAVATEVSGGLSVAKVRLLGTRQVVLLKIRWLTFTIALCMQLHVLHMTCAACSTAVESALRWVRLIQESQRASTNVAQPHTQSCNRSTPGVSKAAVALLQESAEVRVDPVTTEAACR